MAYKTLKEYHIRKGSFPIKVSLTTWDNEDPFIDLYSGAPSKDGKSYKHNHLQGSAQPTGWSANCAHLDVSVELLNKCSDAPLFG